MTTKDLQILLTFLVLLIPFGLIWIKVFHYLKKDIKTGLNYSVLILLSLIGLTAFYSLTFGLAISILKGPLSSLIGPASYATVMTCNLLIIPAFLVTLILTIIHFVKRHNKKRTPNSTF